MFAVKPVLASRFARVCKIFERLFVLSSMISQKLRLWYRGDLFLCVYINSFVHGYYRTNFKHRIYTNFFEKFRRFFTVVKETLLNFEQL